MTQNLDPYRVLGVSPNAGATAIRDAFRRLAFQHHPDRNPDSDDAEERFKTIVAAYEILTNPRLREGWNQRTRAGGRRAGFPDLSSHPPFRTPGRPYTPSRPGQDVTLQVEMTAGEPGEGRELTVHYTALRPCAQCRGRGGVGRMAHCTTCLGWGKLRPPPGSSSSRNGHTTDCAACCGTGYRFVSPCSACQGNGLTEMEQETTVPVPEDMESGKTLVVRGAGHSGPRGGVRGRLRVKIVLRPVGVQNPIRPEIIRVSPGEME